MTYLTLLLFLCFLSYNGIFAVRSCYECQDNNCKEGEIENHKKDCRTPEEVDQKAFLCESIQYSNGSVVKSCVENNGENIEACDKLNGRDGNKCYHCDREYCNLYTSSAMTVLPASIVVIPTVISFLIYTHNV